MNLIQTDEREEGVNSMDKNEVKSKKISTSELWAKLFRSASVERYLAGSPCSLNIFPCLRRKETKKRKQ